jgi:Protein of unknown function (DUF3040)
VLTEWEQHRLTEIERGLETDYPGLTGFDPPRRRGLCVAWFVASTMVMVAGGLGLAHAWAAVIAVLAGAAITAAAMFATLRHRHRSGPGSRPRVTRLHAPPASATNHFRWVHRRRR